MSNPITWNRIEALLHRVVKPGRYVGGEYNACSAPWDAADIHVCLAFPDVYELGMSNFALAILYEILNNHPGTLAHRAFLPAPDMIEAMKAAEIPLYALETYRPVADFDILAVSVAYEQLFTNVLALLDLAGIPVRAAERDERYPLVVGGGHGTLNPEPIAEFFDAFVIGEAEAVITEIVDATRAMRGRPRAEQLRALAAIPGVYVPSLYQAAYASDGGFASLTPVESGLPAQISRRLAATLPPTPVRQVVPNIEIVHNRAVVEIQRGCTRGCRFCQAGMITRPVRERTAQEIVASAGEILDATGYNELALLSLSSADHSEIKVLLEQLRQAFEAKHVSISLPSLRIDSFSIELAETLSHGRRSGFTFAPEAGSDALRRRINKQISTDEILATAEEVFRRGWRTLKLYFMIGLPGETDDDVLALADLARQIRAIGRRLGGRKTEVHVSVSTFVPKPHTVFQWETLADRDTVLRRQGLLQDGIRGGGFQLSWNSYDITRLEALLARGDRRLSAVVERAWRLGARFDAWDELFNAQAWEQAIADVASTSGFESTDTFLDHYLYRTRDCEEALSWGHLINGVNHTFLLRDLQASRDETFLSDCRESCHACGINRTFREEANETWKCPIPA